MTSTRIGLAFLALSTFSPFAERPASAQSSATVVRQESQAYQRVTRSRDGIGVAYLGREIAQVMDAAGADWLERGARVTEERPDLLLSALARKKGMTVADVGAGSGFYSWRMAERIGPTGRVLAVDVQPEMLARLDTEMKRRSVGNVTPVLGTSTDPHLPDGAVDLILMVDVYHEFARPKEMLDALVRSLKVDGRLVFVEYRAEDESVPISPHHKMSVAQVRREAAAAGLTWQDSIETLPWQHILIFTRRGTRDLAH